MKPVLIVDDEEIMRQMIAALLQEMGCETVEAEDGAKGLKTFRKVRPEIVITDIRMPGLDGIELLSRIKAIDPNTEVIVVTGFGEIDQAVKALQTDASDFIQKPFNLEALKVAFNRAKEKISIREELEQAQLQLLQSDKMASLGQLAAGVAHEINNPIGFVNSNLSTLTKYVTNITRLINELDAALGKDGNSELYEKYNSLKSRFKTDFIVEDMSSIISESVEGIQRVKQIVQDLKEFSHVDGKKFTEYDINKCVNSALNIVWNELKYHCEVVKNLGEVPLIKCFPQQINQVLMNIIVNAAQACKDKGLIEITTAPESSGVSVTIKDNGSGIKPEYIKKIFDPFFTTKDVGKGTGLGLNITYNIVRKHGGTIDVESEPGKGSTFIVHLPAEPPVKTEGGE